MSGDFIGDDDINWDDDARRAANEDVPFYEDLSVFDYFSHLMKPGMRVLDLGCNISKWNRLFIKLGLVYEGLDASPTGISVAKERFPENRYYLKRGEEMNFTERYDLVFTHTVLQHMHLRTKKKVVPRVRRALKPEGFFIIQEKCDVETKTTFKREGWIKFIESMGFSYIGGTEPGNPTNGFIFRKCLLKTDADKILEEWDDICKELNIPHFIYCGTCLGFYRDKGYIKGDNDIDVGILGDIEKLAPKLRAHGFKTEKGFDLKHWWKNQVLLDINGWGNKKMYPGFEEFLDSFDTVTYNGRTYYTPHPVEEYLEKEYGKDWRIPSKRQ